MQTLERELLEHPFFQGMDQRYLQQIADCATEVQFEAGTTIFREGGSADRFYLIRHGKVAVEVSAPGQGSLAIQTLGEGDVLGWSWLLAPYRWEFDARAVTLTRALSIDGACIRSKCDQDPGLGYAILKRFAGVIVLRLQAARLQLLDLYGKKA